jgi:hypothetical protein
VLGIGFISRRNDGMSELRISGFKQVQDILLDLLPYIRFKKRQALNVLAAIEVLSSTKTRDLTQENLSTVVDHMIQVQSNNYVTKKKRTREEVLSALGIDPVTT